MLREDAETRVRPDWSCCALYRVSRFLHGTLEWEKVVEEVLDMALEVTGSQKVLLLLAEDGDFKVAGTRKMAEEEIEQAVSFSHKFMLADGYKNSELPPERTARNDPMLGQDWSGNQLCLLLEAWGRVVGVLYLNHPTQACLFPHTFSPFFMALADQIACTLESARQYNLLRQENLQLRQEVENRNRFANILGESAPMRRMKCLLEKVIASPASVLIFGESGTGKELVARALHYEGPRKAKNFVAENCAALPESLLESELFGYVKGAFTSAHQDKPGLFEVADGGTLFLDEIADTSLAVQAKLLRVLESGEFRRLGETTERRTDVRIVVATSRDLRQEVEAGRFRADLYYRLGVLTVSIPPLRERREDIPLLAEHFLQDYARRTGRHLPGFSQEVMTALQHYSWPGNVRQLRNEVERMAALADEGKVIPAELLSTEVKQAQNQRVILQEGESLSQVVKRIKKKMIEEALELCGGNRSRAAEKLGISRPNLQKMMKRLGIR